jgi:protein gp37
MAERYTGVVEKTPGGSLNWTGKVNVVESVLEKPLKKKKPTMYFVNSMSDLFHESVPFEVIDKVFAVMGRCQHHTFQVLTKRPARMLEYYKSDPYQRILNAAYQLNLPKWNSLGAGISNPNTPGAWGWEHVWLGVSVENQQTANERIPLLLQVPAAVRFLSCEPLLGPLRLDMLSRQEYDMTFFDNCLTGFKAHGAGGWHGNKIDWVIVGGESGHGARPVHPDWVRSLRDQCVKAGTAFFFKQHGDYLCFSGLVPKEYSHIKAKHVVDDGLMAVKVGKKAAGRLLDGREWNEFPGKRTEPLEDPDLAASGFDY